jgi:aldose 1-epimerase
MANTLSRAPFGTLADGTVVEAVTLTAGAIEARILTWGATLQYLSVPDRSGRSADIVLGYDTIEDYVEKPEYFGSTIGRFANRIALGRFTLDGQTYNLARTDPPNALHGGARGFDKRVWQIVATHADDTGSAVTFRRVSPDGEEGFPGTMIADAGYHLSPDGALTLTYGATTDAPTVVNLTNHTYWNLRGESSGATALDHVVQIHADRFVAIDATSIPTGETPDVEGTPLDFRTPTPIAARVRNGACQQLVLPRGYDHAWILQSGITEQPTPAVRVTDPHTGRTLDIATTEPSVQFYSGNSLDGSKVGKSGLLYRQGDGIAFETQHYPDSPNQSHFPSTTLDTSQAYRSTTIWRFSTD